MSTLRLLRGLRVSDVSGYLMVSAKASCHDITCESIPGSPPPFLFCAGAREEPGNEAWNSIDGKPLLLKCLVECEGT